MKIRDIEVFQVSWAPGDAPQRRSAFVRVHTDDGLSGIGEASPMQGGLAVNEGELAKRRVALA